MKANRTILLLSFAAVAAAGNCLGRTWTSAEGDRTFEGDFVSLKGENVTIKRSNGPVTFNIDKLSADDQAFAKAAAAKAEAEAKAKEESEKLKEAEIPKALSGKLVKLDDAAKKYEKFSLEDGIIPKYYILYYSASW